MPKRSYRTICQFCHTNCGIVIHVNGDGAVSVEADPNHPMNRGRICAKGAAIPEFIRAEDRLRYPLRKTAAGFKKISWEEALDIAADRLGEIRARFGAPSLVRCSGAPVSYQGRDGFLQFMGEFGSPNMTGAANLCMVPRMTAFRAVTGAIRAEPDYDSTKLVLFWGANPFVSERFGAYAAYNGMKQIVPGLKKRGVRIITIDPFRTATVEQSDEWIRLRPGSDGALGLAMIHVIIAEGLYDKPFVDAYTTGFPELKEHVAQCSPKWAESHTGIPHKTITDLAVAYAAAKPAAIYEGNGLDMYANGVDAVRTVAILIALTGNLDAPGGNVFMPFAPQSGLPTKPAPIEKRTWYEKFPVFGEVPFPAVKEAILGDEQTRPRAMIVHHCNPVLVQANERRTRRALAKLDFLVVNEIFHTATSEMADLILPVSSDFETFGYRAYASIEGGFIALARPVAPPPGEARSVFEVEYELARKMGLHAGYPFRDAESWLRFMVEPSGVTFERLDTEQIVYATPPVQYRKYINERFKTPSGKVELYSHILEAGGCNPLPSYSEPAGQSLAPTTSEEGFSLLGTSRRPATFVHTKLRNLKMLSGMYPEPLAWIHPQDAAGRGITENDAVEVTSPRGQIVLRATLSDDTEPGLIWIDFGWGNPSDGKANINVLTDDAHFDPVSGGTPNRLFLCEVKKCASRPGLPL